jgi:hypothetical protein
MLSVNLINILILTIFISPLIIGLLSYLMKARITSQLLVSETGFLIANLIGLLLLGEQEITTTLRFMGEMVTFSIQPKPVLLMISVLVVLVILIWRFQHQNNASLSHFKFIVLNVGLSFGFIAFISGQFMIRYIALDVVGLMAASTVINWGRGKQSFKDFVTIFQILRLGDLSLLVSIFLINSFSGTLDITQMIESVGRMPASSQTIAIIGFLLAILIKIGGWPFGYWLRRARQSAKDVSFWLPGFLMPALGYYLLYRVIPIVMLKPAYQTLVIVVGMIGLVSCIVVEGLGLVKFDRFKYVGVITASILLCSAAMFGSQSILLFIVGLIFFRLLVYLNEEKRLAVPGFINLVFPLVLNGLIWIINPDVFSIRKAFLWILLTGLWIFGDWIISQRKDRKPVFGGDLRMFELLPEESSDVLSKGAGWLKLNVEKGLSSLAFSGNLLVGTARWLNQNVEIGLFSTGISRLAGFFMKFARWNTEKIERRLEKTWTWIGKKLLSLSEGTLSIVEVEASQKTDELVGDALQSLESYEQKVLKKRMRWDLVWIPLLLIGILIFMLVI